MQTLYIRNLSRRLPITEVKRRLGQLVSRYAPVSRIKMTNRPGMLGQAFVQLSQPSADIVRILDCRFFLGTQISVAPAHSEMQTGRRVLRTRTLIVADIPAALDRGDVLAMFGKWPGTQVRLVRPKSLALIDLPSPEDASDAYSQLDGCLQHNGLSMKITPSV